MSLYQCVSIDVQYENGQCQKVESKTYLNEEARYKIRNAWSNFKSNVKI